MWQGTRVTLVRARLASQARAEGHRLHNAARSYRCHPPTCRCPQLAVRRAKRADVAAFRTAQAQAAAGAVACRLVA